MGLLIEEGAYHVILILSRDYLGDSVVGEVNNLVVGRGVRRLVIHVISPDGRPKYFEWLRSILSSLISCSIVVRYEGSSKEDLINLLKSLRNDTTLILVSDQEFEGVLRELGFNYKFLGGVSYG
ncbi:MAG: hypothetical protein QXH57_03700 [Sulfolobales archaeon]